MAGDGISRGVATKRIQWRRVFGAVDDIPCIDGY
jgi:hypothetical protein